MALQNLRSKFLAQYNYYTYFRVRCAHTQNCLLAKLKLRFPPRMKMSIRFIHLCKEGFRFFSESSMLKKSTIFALSTSPGMSAVAVIRVSGPNAEQVMYQMGRFRCLPPPRKAVLRRIIDPHTQELLDKALLLWFPAPNSYTGEDVCELHVHGGLAVVRTVLRALSKLPLFRQAEPGEFTKRAFLAGKFDLTEIEGLADLLHAETEAQQRQALRQMEGSLFRLYSDWTNRIKTCLANVEAVIDFGEDQNIESGVLENVQKDVSKLQAEMVHHLGDDHRGEKLRSGLNIVLTGSPNVGKSSLLNAICKRDVAIVSSVPGTTRDVVERSVNLSGYLVHFSDTAGIRMGADEIETEGVRRAFKKLYEADVIIFLVEAEEALSNDWLKDVGNSEFLKNRLVAKLQECLAPEESIQNGKVQLPRGCPVLLVLNKMDLLKATSSAEAVKRAAVQNKRVFGLSCLSGSGVKEFLDSLAEEVKILCSVTSGEEPTITQERHRQHVENCLQYLNEFMNSSGGDFAISAEYLRQATVQLGKITGKITTEDILDVIFKDFCIGK